MITNLSKLSKVIRQTAKLYPSNLNNLKNQNIISYTLNSKSNQLNNKSNQLNSKSNQLNNKSTYLNTTNIISTEYFRHILDSYNGIDWKYLTDIYTTVNLTNMNYNRTLLPFNCNPYKLYLLEWKPSAISDIHGHNHNGCIFKIISDGCLKEEVYNPNTEKLGKISYLNKTVNTRYIDNTIGHHRILNTGDTTCYSLHLY